MPLAVKWSAFTKENVGRESDNYGVYELGNYADILYIGEGLVCTRLMCHFADGSEPTPSVSSYRAEYTGGKSRAVHRQNAELNSYYRRHGKYPRYSKRKG